MKTMLGIALFFTLLHAALRVFGCAEHTSILSGMPVSESSVILGPLYVLSYLAFVVATPILAIAAGLEALARRRGGDREFDQKAATVADR